MENLIIACFDVYYYSNNARSCAIVFNKAEEEIIISEYVRHITNIEDYVSGQFFKRELPCILEVFEQITEDIDLIIVDGFVWVGEGSHGLGAHLYKALDAKVPVIGVAKSYFHNSTGYVDVYRSKSSKPLYVSSIGVDLNFSARLIKDLDGKFRIPDVLKKVDELSRR